MTHHTILMKATRHQHESAQIWGPPPMYNQKNRMYFIWEQTSQLLSTVYSQNRLSRKFQKTN